MQLHQIEAITPVKASDARSNVWKDPIGVAMGQAKLEFDAVLAMSDTTRGASAVWYIEELPGFDLPAVERAVTR